MGGEHHFRMIKVCTMCRRGYLARMRSQRFCGNACRVKAFQRRKAGRFFKAVVDELFRRADAEHNQEAAMACTKDQYHLTLQENLRRMNTSRDEAVRMTNEHHGYGSSTALQHDVPDTIVDAPMQQPRGGDAA